MTNKQKESDYYLPVKEAFEDYFRNNGFYVDFEVTGLNRKPLERFLPKISQLLLKLKHVRALPTPDIMGFIWTPQKKEKYLVIVEFKLNPNFQDVFQTKGYAELYGSDLTYLASRESISQSSESTITFISDNPKLLETQRGEPIYIKFLHKTPAGAIHVVMGGDQTRILPDDNEKLLRISLNLLEKKHGNTD